MDHPKSLDDLSSVDFGYFRSSCLCACMRLMVVLAIRSYVCCDRTEPAALAWPTKSVRRCYADGVDILLAVIPVVRRNARVKLACDEKRIERTI